MKQILVVLMMLAAVSAWAQAPATAAEGSVVSNFLFVGYTYAHTDFSPIIADHNGGTAIYDRYLSPNFAVEAECSLVYGNISFKGADYMGGARLNIGIGKITPYIHGLVGYGTTNFKGNAQFPQNGMTTKVGAGVDYFLTQRMGLRVAQVDWRRQYFGNGTDWIEISTGVFYTW